VRRMADQDVSVFSASRGIPRLGGRLPFPR
jgi:hypothetical protein